ncbi:MAG: rhodanese-like domain-containing protein [Terriglobales bacterium]
MYFQQFYLACLSHASYMIGSEGVAAVVDPQRDIGLYLDEAQQHGFTIAHVIETHLHADFVSGHRELAALTGAKIYLSAAARAEFPHVPVHDQDEIRFGHCVLKFLETPGHSLDSVSILVTDVKRSPEPFAILTGDTLFIGDVGRPDLSKGKDPQEMAQLLYRSLHEKLLRLPDGVEVYPTHGAGSLCGRQLSKERSSTIGKERATNYALRAASEAEFVRLITSELPERPGYFGLDKEINRKGAALLSEQRPLPPLRPHGLMIEQDHGAIVLDTCPDEDFAAAHVPGSIHIGLSGQFASWAGTLIGLDKDVVLIAESEQRIQEARVRLARVGIERVVAYLEDGVAGWAREGLRLESVRQISVEELYRLRTTGAGSGQVIDVRRPNEWDDGHIPGAQLIPLHNLPAKLPELDRRSPIAVHCKSGYRSMIAVSLLQAAGFRQVYNVVGGFDAWRTCKLPEESKLRAIAS